MGTAKPVISPMMNLNQAKVRLTSTHRANLSMRDGKVNVYPPGEPQYAVYISCAATERDTIAIPLHRLLQSQRITSFVDGGDARAGEGLHPQMQSAMETAPISIFILSTEFVAREWPMKELNCFLKRKSRAKAHGRLSPVLIPVFYTLGPKCWKDKDLFNKRDQQGQNVFTRDGFFERAGDGFFDSAAQGEDSESGIRNALRELRRYSGVVNKPDRRNNHDNGATNPLLPMESQLVGRIAVAVEKASSDLGLTRREVADPLIVKAALKQGKDKLDTVRLMVLGGSTRGKSSTIASLRREAFNEQRDSTRGVDLSVYYLVLGGQYVDDQEISMLAEKDKFQTRFYAYAASIALEDASVGKPVVQEAPKLSTSSLTGTGSNSSSSSDADRYNEDESMSESVIQLAEDAMNSSEFQDADIEGLTLRCWDFGGQREYEVAHELFISPRSILMLVFDLSRFEDESTRDEEVRELSHWLQTLFAVTVEEDVGSTAASILIVGTRRDSCRYREKVPDYFESLKESLADVLDVGVSRCLDLFNVSILAIENKTAVEEPDASGLHALEEHLDVVAKNIINKSKEVPMRWLAFIENLRMDESLSGICIDRHVIQPRMDGFCFPLSEIDRRDELKALLLYFRDLGEVVLFDTSRLDLPMASREYLVFMDPEKILQALKVIVAPERIRCEGLVGRKDRMRMRQGLLTKQMLKEKWERMEGLTIEEDRGMLVELLTSMDLFVKLGPDLLGVPALLTSGWDDWGWISAGADKREIAAVTTFENYVPFGLIGRLISRLHRTVGAEQTTVQYVRSNAVLLTIGLDDIDASVTQVFMGFDRARRELHWKVRGETYDFRILGRCLTELGVHMRERINTKLCHFEHFFVTDCPHGCNDMNFRLMFPIPATYIAPEESSELEGEAWWKVDGLDVDGVSRICKRALCSNTNCSSYYSYVQAMTVSEPSVKPGMLRMGIPDQYTVFVSHAGPDKDWAVYLAKALERKRLRTFVDRLELTCSSQTGAELMTKAMQTARCGVFIVSPEFFGRTWTMRELRTFIARNATSNTGEEVVIYPIFHRLSYTETRDSALHENPKFRSIFAQDGFFEESSQLECSTDDAIAAFAKLSSFPGLEKKLQELHDESMGRSRIQYRAMQLMRMIRGATNRVFGYEDPDQDLAGVSMEHFFDFAAERIAREHDRSQDMGAS